MAESSISSQKQQIDQIVQALLGPESENVNTTEAKTEFSQISDTGRNTLFEKLQNLPSPLKDQDGYNKGIDEAKRTLSKDDLSHFENGTKALRHAQSNNINGGYGINPKTGLPFDASNPTDDHRQGTPGTQSGAGIDPKTGKPFPATATPDSKPTPNTSGRISITGFESGKSELTPDQKKEWDNFADQYKASGKNDRILLSGTTDPTGTKSINETLGQERAKAVQDYLIKEKHISPTVIGIATHSSNGAKTDKPEDARGVRVYVGDTAIEAGQKEIAANPVQGTDGPAPGRHGHGKPAHGGSHTGAEHPNAKAPQPAEHDTAAQDRVNKQVADGRYAEIATAENKGRTVLAALDKGEYQGGRYIVNAGNNRNVSVSKNPKGGYNFAVTDNSGRVTGASIQGVPADRATNYLGRLQDGPEAFANTMPTMQAQAAQAMRGSLKSIQSTATADALNGGQTISGNSSHPDKIQSQTLLDYTPSKVTKISPNASADSLKKQGLNAMAPGGH